MTIANTNTNNIFNANGVTREWNLTFQYNQSISDLDIYVRHSDGTTTTVTSNYYLDGNVLTYPTVESEMDPLPTGDKLVVQRATPLTQEINLTQQGPLDAETLECGYDKGVILSQELKSKLDRAIVFPIDIDGEIDAQKYIDDLQDLVDTATNQAGISTDQATIATNKAGEASTSATNAHIWAEGTDVQVAALGGTKSSKGWAARAEEIVSSIGPVLKYKGSVATYADLPSTGNDVGDVWNVLADGANYAWDGTAWDNLSGVVDLSAYRTAAAQDVIDSGKQDTISDLSDIRTGAGLGATAVQPGDLATVATTGDYDDLLDKPTLGTMAAESANDYTKTASLATVATTGAYSDLSGTPTLGTMAAESASDYTQTSGLATVAISGSYTDLNNKPTIPTVDQTYSASSTNAQSGTAVASAVSGVLPSQSGNSGKFLTTDGTDASWAAVTSAAADKNLSNLTNEGNIVAAKASMLSSSVDELTPGASGTEYTAPSDGWWAVRLKNQASGHGWVNCTFSGVLLNFYSPNGSTANWGIPLIPAKKGSTLSISWDTSVISSIYLLKFIYAEGSKSEHV